MCRTVLETLTKNPVNVLKFYFQFQGCFEVNEVNLNTTICPRHRDLWGIRWRSNKRNCSCPDQWTMHESNQKGDRGINLVQSRILYLQTEILMPVGSRKYTVMSNFQSNAYWMELGRILAICFREWAVLCCVLCFILSQKIINNDS